MARKIKQSVLNSIPHLNEHLEEEKERKIKQSVIDSIPQLNDDIAPVKTTTTIDSGTLKEKLDMATNLYTRVKDAEKAMQISGKRKSKEAEERYSELLTNATTEYNNYLAEIGYKDLDEIKSAYETAKPKDDRTWFQKGATKDGVTAKNVAKATGASVADATTDATGAVIESGENFWDWLQGLFATYQKSQAILAEKEFELIDSINGGETASEESNYEAFIAPAIKTEKEIAENIEKDLWDGTAIAKQIIEQPIEKATGINVEEDSFLGEKSDALAGSAGRMAAQIGLTAINPYLGGTYLFGTAAGAETESALQNGATFDEAMMSGTISAGAELLTEQLGGVKLKSGKSLVDVVTEPLAKRFTSKLGTALVKAGKLGIDATAEGVEEIVSGHISAAGQKLTYMEDKEIEELFSDEEKLDSFIGGLVLGGLGGGVEAITQGDGYVTGMTKNEQKVFDKLYNDAIAEAEKDGKKLTSKEKTEKYNNILENMENGNISIDTIEEVLGGEEYSNYKKYADMSEGLTNEIDELGKKENPTLAEQYKYPNLQKRLSDINTQKDSARTKLDEKMLKTLGKDRLVESYNEVAKRKEAFSVDLSQYEGKKREAVERAVNSGVLNNTRLSHMLVNTLSTIEADKGITFDYTSNENLKKSGFAIEGKTVNGFVKDGKVTLNVNSSKSWQSVVGHEISHVLEGTDAYTELQNVLFEVAKSKGELDSRRAELTELYKDIEADIDKELTADLVGDYLFSNKDFINRLAGNKKTFRAVYNEIKYLCKVATGKELTQMEKVRQEFDKVWKELSDKGIDTVVENAKADGKTKLSMSNETDIKQKQLEIINETNIAPDEYHTWVRSVDDIKTLAETLEDSDWADYEEFNPDLTRDDILNAIENGKITVYSSYPIENGVFVSPSRMEAESYSGDGTIYEKTVDINDVAWIDPTQGQYAEVNGTYTQSQEGETYNDANKVLYSVSENLDNTGKILYDNNNPLSIVDRAKSNNNSSINWVYKAEIFSVTENKLFHEKISEINQGSQAFQKNSIDEYMLPIENKIVFTDGNYDSPYIREVIEVLTDDSTVYEVVKETIFNVEKGKSNKSEEVRVLETLFGDGIIVTYKSGNGGVYGWQDGKRKGKTRRTVVRNYLNKHYGRGNDSQINEIEADLKGSAFSLSENIAPVDAKYSISEDSQGNELSLAVQKRFANSKAVDENGNLKVLYHGTASGEFFIFDKAKGNVEGDFGSGFYFTDNESDVENNYEGGGADFENKVARRAEQIEAEEEIDYSEAEQRARKELYVGSNKFEVYLNIENPAIVGETNLFDYESYAENYDRNDYDSDEDYEGEIEQLIADDIDQILWDVERYVDVYSTDGLAEVLWNAINEGGIDIEQLKANINNLYLEDSNGNLVGNEVTRQIIESLGYDGIIDNTVSTKFNMNLEEGTTHYIVFKPNQIKSIDNQNPTDNPDIRRSLSKQGEQTSSFGTPLKDLALDQDIAPVANAPEMVTVPKSEQIADNGLPFPNEIAPMTEKEANTLQDDRAKADATTILEAIQTELENVKELREIAFANSEKRIAEKQAELDSKKNKDTKVANKLKMQIERMKRLRDSNDIDFADRIDKLTTREKLAREGKPTTRQEYHNNIMKGVKTELANRGFDLDEILNNAHRMHTIEINDTTPQRVNNKTFGYEAGEALNDLMFNKVALNESKATSWINEQVATLKELSKKYGIKPRSKESAAAQMYAEGFTVDENNKIVSYGDAELAKDFPDAKVRHSIKALALDPTIRQIYDDTLDAINESRSRNAYPEIPRRDNYFLHFREMDDTFSKLGIPFNPNDIKAKDLPTDINGRTADLKPGQSYFSSAMQRKGMRTSFDLLGGVEKYLNSAKPQIFHLDDIQTERAMWGYIAERFGQAEGLENLDLMDVAEQQEHIKKVYDGHLSNYARFLNEHANHLAGKTALMDRTLEGIIGRRGLEIVNTINSQTGKAQVGFNVSSANTNFIPTMEAIARTNPQDSIKAFAQMVANVFHKDGFVENDPALIRRRGADKFAKTAWEKASDAGYVLMSAVDNISSEFIVRTKYNELTRKGMDSEQAHIKAGEWAMRIMADRSLGQMPLNYNSKTLGILTKYQLEVRNLLDSQFYDTIQEAKLSTKDIENRLERNAKTAGKIVWKTFAIATLNHMFGQAFEKIAGYNPAFDIISTISKLFGWDDDEESEDTFGDNLEQAFQELLGDLPYTNLVTDGGRIPMTDALPIKKLISNKDDYGQPIAEGNWGWATGRLKTIGEALPYALPGGYGQIKKTYQGLSMFSDEHPVTGSYTDSGNLRFPVEDTLGNRIQAGIFGQYASENAREYFDNGYAPLKEKQIQEYIDVDMPIKDYWEYREGLAKQEKLEDKLDYISGLDLPVSKKNILANNVTDRKEPLDLTNYDDFSSLEEFDYATKNPDKYAFAKSVGGYDAYKQYSGDLYDIKADKDANGKSISGSRKEKVVEYINNLDADYYTKIILFKSEYPSDDTYNADIINYINERTDLTYEERIAIYTELGFRVSNGYVYPN